MTIYKLVKTVPTNYNDNISVVGIYDSEQKAIKKKKELESNKNNYDCVYYHINEIEVQ